MQDTEIGIHAWRIEERDYRRQQERRGRRFAYLCRWLGAQLLGTASFEPASCPAGEGVPEGAVRLGASKGAGAAS